MTDLTIGAATVEPKIIPFLSAHPPLPKLHSGDSTGNANETGGTSVVAAAIEIAFSAVPVLPAMR